jgi:hypothetical protein
MKSPPFVHSEHDLGKRSRGSGSNSGTIREHCLIVTRSYELFTIREPPHYEPYSSTGAFILTTATCRALSVRHGTSDCAMLRTLLLTRVYIRSPCAEPSLPLPDALCIKGGPHNAGIRISQSSSVTTWWDDARQMPPRRSSRSITAMQHAAPIQ